MKKFKIKMPSTDDNPAQKKNDKVSLKVVVNNINCFMQAQSPGD